MNLLTVLLLALSFLWVGSEVLLTIIRRSRSSTADADRASLGFLWLAIGLAVTTGIILGTRGIWYVGGGSLFFPVLGLLLILGGLILRAVAIISLGRHFTVNVAISSGHHIVKTGLYQWIRHPAYAGTLLSFLGLGVFHGSVAGLLTILVPIGVAFLYRIHVEEEALTAAFGDEYRKYCAATKRLFPGLY